MGRRCSVDVVDIVCIVMCVAGKMMLLYVILTGDCPVQRYTKKIIQDETASVESRPFLPGLPRQVILLACARCGSSYLGNLLATHPNTFYSYEPLDALYVALYGTRQGWNVRSDILYHRNGTERIPDQHEVNETSKYIRQLLNCHTDEFYPEIWLHGFWQKYSHYHPALKEYISCLQKQDVHRGDFINCQLELSGQCEKRLDWTNIDENNTCPVGVRNKHYTKSKIQIDKYEACIRALEERVHRCRQHFTKACEKSTYRVTKTVRMSMATVEELIKVNPNLRIVHLVRDPRAVVYSRSQFDPSTHGLYAGTPMNLVKEATAFCSGVRRDLTIRKQLEIKYPAVFMQILHEELVADPLTEVRKLYNFLGMTLDLDRQVFIEQSMSSWLEEQNNNYLYYLRKKTDTENDKSSSGDLQNVLTENKRNAHSVPSIEKISMAQPNRDGAQGVWRFAVPVHIIRGIDRVCESVYEHIPYNKVNIF